MGSSTFEGFHNFTPHADYVTASTGLRQNFIYDANLVSGHLPLSFDKATATSYVLRNYDGDVLKSGALVGGAAPTITDADLTWRGRGPYGWYRMYLFGPTQPNWGTAYGDFTFYRVSTSAAFAANPADGTSMPTAFDDPIARGVMGFTVPRFNAQISTVVPYSTTTATTATGTSISIAKGDNGSTFFVKYLVWHVFLGDPSQLATPTQTGGSHPAWTMEGRASNGSNVTVTAWSTATEPDPVFSPGTITFSSGTKSGTHYLYFMQVYNGDWSKTRTAATATGTGTSASANLASQSFGTGIEEMVFGCCATASGVQFNAWSSGMSKSAWGLWSDVPNSGANSDVLSAPTGLYPDSTARTVSTSWNTSKAYAMVVVPLACRAGSLYPTGLLALSKTYWADQNQSARDTRRPVVLFADGINDRTGALPDAIDAMAAYSPVYEPFNEPIFQHGVQDYIDNHLTPFYDAAIAHDPTVRILGCTNVTFNDGTEGDFFNDFLDLGGLAKCTDVSLHPYNCFNGEFSMTRRTLESARAKLTAAGAPNIPLWLTEQGYGWEYRGQMQPRVAGRWTMTDKFIAELYGVPLERNSYWYDRKAGFDDSPEWWISPTGPGPQALPVRTMVAEIGNRPLDTRFDFGDGLDIWAGGSWLGGDGSRTVGFMAQSSDLPSIRFATNATSLVTVDCWGNTSTVNAANGYLTVASSEMPTWIRVPVGKTCTLVAGDWDWGTNHATGTTPTASFTGNVATSRLVNGVFDNQYIISTSQMNVAQAPFNDASSTSTFPATISVPLGSLKQVGRVNVVCPPPWQSLTALMDFDIEYQNNDSSWTIGQTYSSPASTSFSFVSQGRGKTETFWSQRNVFCWVPTSPVNCKAVRLTIRSCSDGPFESSVWTNNGNAGTKRIVVSEIQVWDSPPVADAKPQIFLIRSNI